MGEKQSNGEGEAWVADQSKEVELAVKRRVIDKLRKGEEIVSQSDLSPAAVRRRELRKQIWGQMDPNAEGEPEVLPDSSKLPEGTTIGPDGTINRDNK